LDNIVDEFDKLDLFKFCIAIYYTVLVGCPNKGCPNYSARFNFVIKRTIYSKSADIFISV